MFDIDFLHDADDIATLAPQFTQKFKAGSYNTHDIELLRKHGDNPLYSARENIQARIIFTIVNIVIAGRSYAVAHYIQFLPTHNYDDCCYIKDASAFLAYLEKQIPIIQSALERHLVSQLPSSSTEQITISPVHAKKQAPIILTSEQELILQGQLPLYVNGCAGAGKTKSVKPLFEKHLQNNPNLRALYITSSPLLVFETRKLLIEYQQNIMVKTFADLYRAKVSYATKGVMSLDAILAWIDNNRGAVRLDAIVIFQVFQIIAAIGEERYGTEQFKHGSIPFDPALRNTLLAMYRKHKLYLINNKLINIYLIDSSIISKEAFDLIIVDEMQNMSLSMLMYLRTCVSNDQIILLGDEHQRTHSIFPLIELARLYFNFEFTQMLLTTTKRCAPAITRFDNHLLRIKVDAIGNEMSSSITHIDADPDALQQGRVSFENTKDANLLSTLNQRCAELIQQHILFAVVVLDPKLKSQVKAPVVLTIYEAEGLEYPVVIVVAPLNEKSWQSINKRLSEIEHYASPIASSDTTTSTAKTFKRKTSDHISHAIVLNRLYVVATRPQTHLHFFIPPLDKKLPAVWTYLGQEMTQGSIFESQEAQQAAAADLSDYFEKARKHFLLEQMDAVEGIWRYHFRQDFPNILQFKARLATGDDFILPLSPATSVTQSALSEAKPNSSVTESTSVKGRRPNNNRKAQQSHQPTFSDKTVQANELRSKLKPKENSVINYFTRKLKNSSVVHVETLSFSNSDLSMSINPSDIESLFKLNEKQLESVLFNVYFGNINLMSAFFNSISHNNAFWHYAEKSKKIDVLAKILKNKIKESGIVDDVMLACPDEFFKKLALLNNEEFLLQPFSLARSQNLREMTRLEYLLTKNQRLLKGVTLEPFIKMATDKKLISLSLLQEGKIRMDVLQYAIALMVVTFMLYHILSSAIPYIGDNCIDIIGSTQGRNSIRSIYSSYIDWVTQTDEAGIGTILYTLSSLIAAWFLVKRFCSYHNTLPIVCTINEDNRSFILPGKTNPLRGGFFPSELHTIAKYAQTTLTSDSVSETSLGARR